MRYKELKEKVKSWGQNYNISTLIEFDYKRVKIKIYYADLYRSVAHIDAANGFSVNLFFYYFNILPEDAKRELFKIVTEFAATKPEDRLDEKRFIIPLPGLVTTDGSQQYLTKNITFFASRRDKGLRQTWKEEHLKFVPEIYRQFAVEFDEDKEY